MKRLVAALCAGFFALSLLGCGGGGEPPKPPVKPPVKTDEPAKTDPAKTPVKKDTGGE